MRFDPTDGDAFSDEIIILQSGTFLCKRAMGGKRLTRARETSQIDEFEGNLIRQTATGHASHNEVDLRLRLDGRSPINCASL